MQEQKNKQPQQGGKGQKEQKEQSQQDPSKMPHNTPRKANMDPKKTENAGDERDQQMEPEVEDPDRNIQE